ncbi:type I inositol 1,4,5-trisphosphate 5-phosphatase-like isoform X2 [Rhinatrema bivittatum]|uniref:type I inositol 1,4,5-trisphosphate 5-phosphatase-like isoform X2 n=1 Tax=Rhinatrema bivittatum TaxID=194408 RepID=UPI00112A1A94|nr:type I inositol 1,4,5-trisphosphate 5-phosphatase-like isoform X2 [Rhinatrema bivittatum]
MWAPSVTSQKSFRKTGCKSYIRTMMQSGDMSEYDRTRVYIDSDFTETGSFTALGNLYFVHRSLDNVWEFDFREKKFLAVRDTQVCLGSLEEASTLEKERFAPDFWLDFKWTRKGYMRTRWKIQNRAFDLLNVHLFHDASNLIACDSSPSVYAGNRKKALHYVLERLNDHRFPLLPFFLFGDFNFRLDARNLIQSLCSGGTLQTVRRDSDGRVKKIICKERNSHKVLLLIEMGLFECLNQATFREDYAEGLLPYDKEPLPFLDVLSEQPIVFPPSYPYSEDCRNPTKYEHTRCPAWCDRVLMSHSAKCCFQEEKKNESSPPAIVYGTLGDNVCMGDHKPVFLFFRMKSLD